MLELRKFCFEIIFMKLIFTTTFVFFLFISAVFGLMQADLGLQSNASDDSDNLSVKGEKHLTNIKQLSFAGENAEAYFSSDGKQLIFQSKRE